MRVLLLLGLSLLGGKSAGGCYNISWTGGEAIRWPSPGIAEMYKSTGMFVGKNVLATRFAIYKEMAFVALPRLKSGIPLTFGKLNLRSRHCEGSIEAFPSWSLQAEGNCQSMQSVVDTFLDSRRILWALDSGIVNSLDMALRQCPPKVLAFNPKTGKLVRRIGLASLASSSSRLQYLVVEVSPSGRVFLYISDAANRCVIVYEALAGRGYRLHLPAELSYGAPSRDVLYLGLLPENDGGGGGDAGGGCLLLSYLGAQRSFALKTRQLETGLPTPRLADLGAKPDKLVFLGSDSRDGRLFWRKQARPEIYSWEIVNCSRIDNDQPEIVYAGNNYQLTTHVVPDCKRRQMRLLESTFPDYFHGRIGCGVNHVLGTFSTTSLPRRIVN